MKTKMKLTATCPVLLVLLLAIQGNSQVNTAEAAKPAPMPTPTPTTKWLTNRAEGLDYKVEVKSVVEKSTSADKVVYDVSYTYDFKGRTTVWVDGMGVVPAKGKFRYMTSDSQIEFRESPTGPLITGVSLEETRPTADGSTDLPKDSEFPLPYRTNIWTSPPVFSDAVVAVIQKEFPSGYNVRQEGQISYYISTYRRLDVSNPNLRSQIAIRISQPYEAAADRFTYRIQFVARDRPRLSDTWRYGDACSRLTISAAQKLVDKLFAALAQAGGNRK